LPSSYSCLDPSWPMALETEVHALAHRTADKRDTRRTPKAPDLNKIRAAQMEATLKRMADDAPAPMEPVTPDVLCCNWTDSYGNLVSVYSRDAFDARLIATLSKPPRPDINLPLKRVESGRGWHCGDAVLASSSPEQLKWAFPNGSVSVWTRRAESGNKSQAVPGAASSSSSSSNYSHVWVPIWAPYRS